MLSGGLKGSYSDLEFDENELWGQSTKLKDNVSDRSDQSDLSDSDSSCCSAEHLPAHQAAASDDENTGAGWANPQEPGGATTQHSLRDVTPAAGSATASGSGATAAQLLAAKHPGMGGGDSTVSLTRTIPDTIHRRRTLANLRPQTVDEAASTDTTMKLGSSVPIAIPMAHREVGACEGDSSPRKDARATTFVPPHLLEQVAGRRASSTSMSLHGTSPAASLKRVRLVNRNNVLRSIGFLEEKNGGASGITDLMDPIREGINEGPFGSSPIDFSASPAVSPSISSFVGASGLSSALKSAKMGY